MDPKCLTAQISAIALLLSTSVAMADVNYAQRAKEQAARAAAAAQAAAGDGLLTEPPRSETAQSLRSAEPAATDSLPEPPPATQPAQAAQPSESRASGNGPLEDQPLVIDISNLYDQDGLGSLTIQWQVQSLSGGWQSIDGASTQSFTPRQEHVGRSLRVVIQYIDGQGTLEVIETAPTGAVQNVNDLPAGVPMVTGTPMEDNTLKIDASGITDEDGLGTLAYRWERSVDGARWSSYSSNSSNPALLRLNQAEVGFAYRGLVSYVDGFGTEELLVTPATNMVKNIDDPVIGEVVLTGTPQKGAQLSVDVSGLSDDDGIANIRTTWEMSDDGRRWVAITEASGQSMTLSQNHVGKVIRVRASVVDAFGIETTLFSQPTTVVANVNSRPSGVIRILAPGN